MTARAAAHLVVMVAARRYALTLQQVDEVARMAWITPVPDTPAEVCGVVDVHGSLLAVIDLEVLLSGQQRAPCPTDFLVMISLADARLALRVDSVEDLLEMPAVDSPPEGAPPPFISGHLRVDGEAIPVVDVSTLVRPALRAELGRAVQASVLGAPVA